MAESQDAILGTVRYTGSPFAHLLTDQKGRKRRISAQSVYLHCTSHAALRI